MKKKIFVVVDYGMGNIRSIMNAFKFLGCNTIISNSEKEIMKKEETVLEDI